MSIGEKRPPRDFGPAASPKFRSFRLGAECWFAPERAYGGSNATTPGTSRLLYQNPAVGPDCVFMTGRFDQQRKQSVMFDESERSNCGNVSCRRKGHMADRMRPLPGLPDCSIKFPQNLPVTAVFMSAIILVAEPLENHLNMPWQQWRDPF